MFAGKKQRNITTHKHTHMFDHKPDYMWECPTKCTSTDEKNSNEANVQVQMKRTVHRKILLLNFYSYLSFLSALPDPTSQIDFTLFKKNEKKAKNITS